MKNNETRALEFTIERYLSWCKFRNKKPNEYKNLQQFRYLYDNMIYY